MSLIMSEEERNQVLREFESFIKENKPQEVRVVWKGVYETIERSTSGSGYVKVHLVIVEAIVNNRKFSITYGSGAIASDSPKDFGEILERNGYTRVMRYGATGYWNYIYEREEPEEEEEPDEEGGEE